MVLDFGGLIGDLSRAGQDQFNNRRYIEFGHLRLVFVAPKLSHSSVNR
jgi:hypothetical protein